MRCVRCFVHALFVSASVSGCAVVCGVMPSTGMMGAACVSDEPRQVVDGTVLSGATLDVSADTKDRFAKTKKVAIISLESHTGTEFVNRGEFEFGPVYERTLVAWERALAHHGFEVIPHKTVLADPVYQSYDARAATVEMFNSMPPVAAKLSVSVLKVMTGDMSEITKAIQDLYLTVATGGVGAIANLTPKIDSALDGVKTAENAVSSVSDTSGNGVGEQVADLMDKLAKQRGVDPKAMQLRYIPATSRKDMLGQNNRMSRSPSAWAKSQPPDDYLVRLAKSLGADALVLVRTYTCWDRDSGDVGLCTVDAHNYVQFFASDGTVLQTPMLETLPIAQPWPPEIRALGQLQARTSPPPEVAQRIKNASALYLELLKDAARRGIDTNNRQVMSSVAWVPDDQGMVSMDVLADRLLKVLLAPVGRGDAVAAPTGG